MRSHRTPTRGVLLGALALLVPTARTLAGSITVVESSPTGVTLEYSGPPAELVAVEGGSVARLPGFGALHEVGRPALPQRVERIALPEGYEARLEPLEAREDPHPGVQIVPEPRWTAAGPRSRNRVPLYEPDPIVYGSDTWYPSSEAVRLGEVGYLRDQRYVEVVLNPILWNPARAELRETRRLRFRIDFVPVSSPAALEGVPPSGEGAATTRRLVQPYRPDPPSVEAEGGDHASDDSFVNAGQAREYRSARGAALSGALEESAVAAYSASAASAVSTVYKLTVNQDGIYRIDKAWVATNAPDLIGRPSANFRIDCQGSELPITINDTNGTFNDSGDYIEFYGQKLGWDILNPDSWDKGDYTDDNVYLLYAQSTPGQRVPTRNGAPTDTLSVPADYQETIHHEVDTRFVQEVPAIDYDHWVEDPAISASGGTPASVTYTVATPGVSTNTTTASIKVALLGEDYFNNYHRSTIKVNGTTVKGPSDWDGFRAFIQGQDDGAANFNQSLLTASTSVAVSLPLGRTVNGTPINSDLVDQQWIEITYGRKFVVDQDILIFTVPNQSHQYKVTGLTNGANEVYEITKTIPGTNLVSPVQITNVRVSGTSPNKIVEFEAAQDTTPGAPPTRRFAVVSITNNTATGDLVPASVRADTPSNLKSPANGADWLVIADAGLLDSSPSSDWQTLLTRRAAQGLRVKVVSLEDVYDEFSYSIADPQAIRDFLSYAYFNWTLPKPAEVVLLGDATLDYKNGYGWGTQKQFVPTYMRSQLNDPVLGYYSDDVYYGAIAGGDDLPDLQIGRIPSHSVAETDAWAKKIDDYETASTGPPNPAWMHNDVFVASSEDPSFESVQESEISTYLAGTAHTFNRTYEGAIQRANPGWTLDQVATETRNRIQSQLNGAVDPTKDIGPGAVILSYLGHGGWQNWADNSSIFTTKSSGTDDLTPVSNAAKLPFMIVADCISGGFAETSRPTSTDLTYGFAEDFVTTAAKGIVGAFAPAHLTVSFTHELVLDTFFGEVYGPKRTRNAGALAERIREAFNSTGDPTSLRSYSLLADPHLNLVIPAPKPPTSVTATGQDKQVLVSWTASPAATTYRVYRSVTPGGSYVLAGQSAGTSFTDSGPAVVNCTTYYYVVTSVDSGGFEGAWSQFNTGCGTGGTCVSATPRKTTAPAAPTGLTASDAGTGGTVHLTWTPDAASDEVLGYTVYARSAPGPYTIQQSVGLQTDVQIAGLVNNTTYFFAVSANNCSQGEGAKSAEASAVPHLVQGIRPPKMIGDLHVTRRPDPIDHIDDTLLTWTPPTLDIYDGPVTLASQEVYAGTTPLYPLDVAHRLTTLAPTATSYIHPNGYGDASNHYYLVVAVDTNGNRSGASRDLPRGIDTMTVVKSGGNLVLSWPAVTVDFDGNPTKIDHYDLYADGAPFRRSDIGPAKLQVGGITGTTVTVPLPAANRFYSIIAVDQRGQLSVW